MEQPVASTAVAPRGAVSPAPAVRPTTGVALLQTATGKSQQRPSSHRGTTPAMEEF